MTQDNWTESDRSRPREEYLHADLTHEIIGGFYRVYNYFGYGFSEKGYQKALAVELRRRRLRVEIEVPFEMVYEGVVVGLFRADMIIEGKVVVESKAGLNLDPTTMLQLMNYLRLSRVPIGLALHFGPRPSIKRLISNRFQLEDVTPK